MSEERFDRIENQLAQVIQAISGLQQNMAITQQNMVVTQQNMALIQQNMTAMQQNMVKKQDLSAIEQKVSSVEHKVSGIERNLPLIQRGINLIKKTTTETRIDLADLNDQVDNLQVTTRVGIRDSIRDRRSIANILDCQERASSRLQSRVERLEDINNPDRTTDI
jgi:chromosome segregation ATPase